MIAIYNRIAYIKIYYGSSVVKSSRRQQRQLASQDVPMNTLPSARLAALGLSLPRLRKPAGNFVMAKRVGSLLYLSGQGPNTGDGPRICGKVGEAVTREEAYQHARTATLNVLAAADDYLGSIDHIDEIVKVLGFVNAASDFTDHPAVINGCSDLLLEVFGPTRGHHARSAIGAGSLPSGIPVEIEMIVAVGS